MNELFTIVLKIALVIFMAGSLLGMGLRLQLRQALVGLRNVRFVAYCLLWGFVLSPALAVALTRIAPLSPPYAMGLLLIGMTPCAPFLPQMVDRARGEMGYAASVMLLSSLVLVVYMPVAVPLMVDGLTVSAWVIAKPLLLAVLLPLAIGMAIVHVSNAAATVMRPYVKRITDVATIVMLVLCVLVYGKGFVGAAGSYAFATQLVFFGVVTVVPSWLAFGLSPGQRSVLSLGMCTRNCGAALAPLFTVPNVDQRAIVMVVIAVPLQLIVAVIAANWFRRRAVIDGPRPAPAQSSGVWVTPPTTPGPAVTCGSQRICDARSDKGDADR